MRKPFIHALAAALYIVIIVGVMWTGVSILKHDTIIIPMAMLSLFVLSAAIMGYLFLSEPIQLFIEDKKKEAITFFGKTVGFFACFVALFIVALLISSNLF